MIRQLQVKKTDEHTVCMDARICCQNPALNPMQMAAAIELYLPEMKPDFVKSRRVEVYDTNESVFR